MYLPSNSIGNIHNDQLVPIDDIRLLSEDISTSSFSQTRAGWVIPTVTSIISFFASALIIYIIARSDRNRYTATYHRIMVFMSIADMLSSLAISLTTIPMPKDVNEVYSFDGNSYGTVVTCEIQAFTYILGVRLSAGASICLSLYYLLTIRYHVSHEVITKCVEPTFLVMTLLMVVIPPIFTTFGKQLYNPSPLMSWCIVSEFPQGCSKDDGVGCIRGQEGATAKARTNIWFQVATLTILHVVCLGSIVATVYIRDKEKAQTELLENDESHQPEPICEEELQLASIEEVYAGEVQHQEVEEESDAPLQHNNGANRIQDTQMIVKHAIMYAVAFIGTNFLIPQLSPDSTLMAILTITFRPFLGFFNALIFISQKVYIIRQADENLTFCKALNRIITSPSVVPAIVIELPSRLTTLKTLRNGSASSSISSFPTRGKSSIGPSLVVSNSGGSKELPADREPALKRYYDGVHIPSSDMPTPAFLPAVTQDAIGCTIQNEPHAKSSRSSYLSDFSYLDTIDEENIVTTRNSDAGVSQ